MGSTKNQLRLFQNITAGDMSANITSAVTSIQFLDNVSIQLNYTGTPTGTFAVQVSDDYSQDSQGNVLNAGNWVDLPLDGTPAAAGAADTIIIDLNQLSFPWIRVAYIFGSGVGSLDGFITAKMI